MWFSSIVFGAGKNKKYENIDDVTRVLEDTGETSAYYDTSYNYVPTKNAKTIGQIAKEIGYS